MTGEDPLPDRRSARHRLLKELAHTLYPAGPGDRDVWERAGGQVSTLDLQGSGETQWYRALRLLEKGGGGAISSEALIRVMHNDHPQNQQLSAANSDHAPTGQKVEVDFAILTIRDDEHRAVLQRFPHEVIYRGIYRTYSISHLKFDDGTSYTIAIAAALEQGGGQAQALASAMIADLNPQWIVVNGIAGAVPSTEFTLGDVVVANRLRDFSVGAAKQGQQREIVDQGGAMSVVIQDQLAMLPAIESRLSGWNDETSIGLKKPLVRLDADRFYGTEEWKKETKEALEYHFGRDTVQRTPLVTRRTIVAGNLLVKDTETMQQWLDHGRDIAAVEMELSGIYTAARGIGKDYPILAVRGISDIVGLKRQPEWTAYACHTAAAFTYAFLKSKPIPPRPPRAT